MKVVKCPKCGGTHVQLSNERSKHGILWTLLFGIYYLCWWCIKAMCALFVFIAYDWYMLIVKAVKGKSHICVSKRMISNRSRVYYCHDCGYNFRG